MNRREALFLTLLAGGAAPAELLAQARRARDPEADADPLADIPRRPKAAPKRVNRRPEPDDPEGAPAPGEDGPDTPPADFPEQAGHQWKSWDISRYTAQAPNQGRPQADLIEWIFRRTGTSEWHGDKIAVLGANRAKLRAYHNPKILEQVDEVVERFIDSYADILKIRVRFVAADSPKWRYAIFSRLNPIGSGPQGQQIWTVKADDAGMVIAQLGISQGGKPLTDQTIQVVNGQKIKVETTAPHSFVAGLQRTGAVGQGFQPGAQKLEEGVVLRLSPLLSYEGDAIDAAIDLKAETVRHLHKTRVIAPREIGPAEMTIDVPEVCETRLNQTVKGWPVGQTLVIAAGIQPGILQSKSGPLKLKIPGTYPTTTELLVFLDAEIVDAPARQPRNRD